jgi:hypothetical protein
MSVKWERSKRWDDRHIPGWLWPVKAVLRAFSSIKMAVTLLSLVALYGIVASVPIGMLALIPTMAVYAISLLAAIGLAAGGVLGAAWKLGLSRASRSVRFLVLFVGGLALSLGAAWAWHRWAWPVLHYDPARGTGVRIFATFVDHYQAVTLRRLPGMEMSELEFYAWWPLRTILIVFVLNMIVATARRIEFVYVNLGVLTVHTGIVMIALGSVFYGGLKKEGDMLLVAGQPDAAGKPTPGPATERFYDNTRVALYVNQDGLWEQRPLRGVPRYNEYGLEMEPGKVASEAAGYRPVWKLSKEESGGYEIPRRTLDVPVPDSPMGLPGRGVSMRIVGYAPYAESATDWVQVDPATIRVVGEGQRLNPLRIVSLYDLRPESMKGKPRGAGEAAGGEKAEPAVAIADARPVMAYTLLPGEPSQRLSDSGVIAVEYTIGMSEERWKDLSRPLPPGTSHALVVEVPGRGFSGVFAVTPGAKLELGETGYSVEVKELSHEPPFPIITEGFKGSTSSVAIVRVIPPGGGAGDGGGYERWVYHRFPEIDQDLLDEMNERGMPRRRNASPDIRISYIDADQLQVYLDERADGTVRGIVREPGGAVRVLGEAGFSPEASFSPEAGFEVVPYVAMKLSERWAHAEKFERPRPVAFGERDKQFVGTHDKAMLGVELSLGDEGGGWKRLVWVPFSKYLGVESGTERQVVLPDGRLMKLSFGRLQHRLPGFEVQLTDFEMLAYDHRGSPRDYRSTLRVSPSVGIGGVGADFEEFVHKTSLNEPLRAPFHWDDSRPLVANVMGRLASGLSPNQYKFSQAGWDRQGWMQTQEMADRGEIPRARASFTILGVGNNPGIHVIALGAVLMGMGIPWAFYVKPWLVQRKKRRIQEQLKAGTYVRPGREAAVVANVAGAGAGTNGRSEVQS